MLPLAASPNFANSVLHWQTRAYQAATTPSTDPKSGHWITSDVWVQVGPDNSASHERATTTLDGQFEEALFYDFVSGAVTRITAQPVGVKAQACSISGTIPESKRSRLAGQALPTYLSLRGLPNAGFGKSAFAFELAPPLPESALGKPQSTLASGKFLALEAAESTPTGMNHVVVSVDQDSGRLLGWARLDSAGKLLHEEISSDIEVFAAGQIPASYFDPLKFAGGCK